MWAWSGGWAATFIPQQWKYGFVRDRESSQAEKGVGAPGGEVCAHDVAASVPHSCTEQIAVKQGCAFCAVGDPNKRPDSVLNATSTLLGDGSSANSSPKVFIPFSSESLVFHRSRGRENGNYY